MQCDIQNIVLFVGDAVRYDESVSILSEIGRTYKTTSASLHTPASFASMLTGRHVPSHGIKGFQYKLSKEILSLVDLNGWNTAFSNKTGTMHEDLHRIFDHYEQASLDDLDEPFIWVVRDPGGHAPYNGYDGDTYNQINEDASGYFYRVAGDRERIREDYRAGVEASIERFREVVAHIQDRGIERETLMIYTSDHGELLGEYALLGHNHVACPELVYVPTTLVHPEIDPGTSNRLFRHVDIFPTILDVLDTELDETQFDGKPIRAETPSLGYNHFEMIFYSGTLLKNVSLKVRSCWDTGGGHVFVDSSYLDSLLCYLGLMFTSPKGKHMLRSRSFWQPLQRLLPGYVKHGNPGFSRDQAREHVEQIRQMDMSAVSHTLDGEAQERLEDLGYI